LSARRPLPPRLPPPNNLLAALGDRECERLLPSLRLVSIRSRHVLQRQGEPLSAIYFPNSGVASVLTEMQDGRAVEVTAVGREGMIGVSAALEADAPSVSSIVQVTSGSAERMSLAAFCKEMNRRGPFAEIVHHYTRRFMSQVMQSAACHGLHTVEQRCCRWLLLTEHRVGHGEFRVTHEFLASLWGVRRSTVTVVLRGLQRRGLIEYRRHLVRIRRPERLAAVACECYVSLRESLDAAKPA
jgi:CRP-like cAMP-binding protein